MQNDRDDSRFKEKITIVLKDFEGTKNIHIGQSPYQIMKKRQLDSNEVGLDQLSSVRDYIDITNENIEAIEENLKIIAFGIDYNKYARFKFLIPVTVQWFMGGDEARCILRYKPIELNSNQIEFCKNFIVESALKLQQFDFKIPEDFALTNNMNSSLDDFF